MEGSPFHESKDHLAVLWKKKGRILIATGSVAAVATVVSLVLPQVWEIDMIVQPSRLLVQTREGRFEDFYVVDARQLAGQISQKTFDGDIAEDLGLDLRRFPRLRAENLRDTRLLRVSLREKDVEKGRAILRSLFDHLKADMDDKVDVERKAIAATIATNENIIKQKLTDIRSKEIEIAFAEQEIRSAQRKREISDERARNIIREMEVVRARIGGIEREQKNALAETRSGNDAIGMLLYSNEIQQNLRYYNTLDEQLSVEKTARENHDMQIKAKGYEIQQFKIVIEKLNREIEMLRTDIELQKERMRRIDDTRMIKKPTPTVYPVFPNKKLIVLAAAVAGLIASSMIVVLFAHLQDLR